MPHSDQAASTATHEARPDTQTLVALLEGLLPLLQQIRSQTWGQPAQFDQTVFAIQNPILDHQAAVSLVEDITADSLRTLSAYLEAHAARHTELQGCVGIVTQAAHCFGAREYGQAFGLIWQAYRAITTLRAINPQLPTLRGSSLAESSSAPPRTSIH